MAVIKAATPATLPATQRKVLSNASVSVLMGNGIFRESVTPESLIAVSYTHLLGSQLEY